MEGIQLWQSDGLGADRDTLERILRIFKSDGVKDIQSKQALSEYIKKLDDSKLQEMYEISKETALQLFTYCFGVVFAAEKYSKWQNDVIRKAVDILKKEKETAEKEAETNRAALQNARKVINEEIDRIRQEYGILKYEKEEADQQIKELRNALEHYKADLYDFYTQEGKLPRYERK